MFDYEFIWKVTEESRKRFKRECGLRIRVLLFGSFSAHNHAVIWTVLRASDDADQCQSPLRLLGSRLASCSSSGVRVVLRWRA